MRFSQAVNRGQYLEFFCFVIVHVLVSTFTRFCCIARQYDKKSSRVHVELWHCRIHSGIPWIALGTKSSQNQNLTLSVLFGHGRYFRRVSEFPKTPRQCYGSIFLRLLQRSRCLSVQDSFDASPRPMHFDVSELSMERS